jgi:hypothetical protein
VAGLFWRLVLYLFAGWLSAHTSISPEVINAWQGDALKIFVSLSVAGYAAFLSWAKLRKIAKARAALAEVIVAKKEEIRSLK